jgi:hypothetical protein
LYAWESCEFAQIRSSMQIDLRSDYERQQDIPLRDGLLSKATVMRGIRKGSSIAMKVGTASNSYLPSTF